MTMWGASALVSRPAFRSPPPPANTSSQQSNAALRRAASTRALCARRLPRAGTQ